MRPRINRSALCSSENYKASRKAHLQMSQEKHSHFCGLLVSGEIKVDVPVVNNDNTISPKFKTITIFGKEMTLTIEEYNTHYAKCKF